MIKDFEKRGKLLLLALLGINVVGVVCLGRAATSGGDIIIIIVVIFLVKLIVVIIELVVILIIVIQALVLQGLSGEVVDGTRDNL